MLQMFCPNPILTAQRSWDRAFFEGWMPGWAWGGGWGCLKVPGVPPFVGQICIRWSLKLWKSEHSDFFKFEKWVKFESWQDLNVWKLEKLWSSKLIKDSFCGISNLSGVRIRCPTIFQSFFCFRIKNKLTFWNKFQAFSFSNCLLYAQTPNFKLSVNCSSTCSNF